MDDETLETLKRIRIQSLSNGDEIDSQLRKVFVGGLPQNLPQSIFRKYFENFGKISECEIVLDKRSRKPRGFGFVTFTDIRSVNIVLKLKDKHVIEGKWVDVKTAVPIQQMKEVMVQQQQKHQKRVEAM